MKEYRWLKAIKQEEKKYVEETSSVRQTKKNGWSKWCAMAACLCLATGVLLWFKGSQVEVNYNDQDFTLEEANYNLSIYSNDTEDIYACSGIVLSESEGSGNQSKAMLTDVLGFDMCHIEMEKISPYQYEWHYYVKVDGEDVCVAEPE